MKQLKFMLAAAAAFGIATAQAGEKTTYTVGTAADAPENFNAAELADQNPVGAIAGYDFQPVAPATAADNESVIKDGALNVNTGTDPLLRALDWSVTGDSANYVGLTAEKSLYIDTMVQFTVTPEGDTVTAGTDDKLLIYLKEVPAVKDEEGNETVAATTKLMVKAAKYTAAQPPAKPATCLPVDGDVEVSNFTVVPNAWYHMVVTAKSHEKGFTVFEIQLAPENGEFVTLKNSAGLVKDNDTQFPSLKGFYNKDTNPNALSLQYVGFAGEGKVDDLLVWTVETISSVDFTLTLGTGVSAVTYVIGSADSVKITETKTLEKLEAAKITISAIDYLVGYKAGDNGLGEYDVSADGLTIDAAEVVINDGTAEGSTATTAADLQITNEKFAKDSPAQLTKLTTWAKTYSVSLSTVNGMTFADEEVESEAYLLNCAPTAEAVEDAKAAFKFPAITAGEVPAVYEPKEGYNVEPKIFGADSIEALKTSEVPATADHKFFKAVLTK